MKNIKPKVCILAAGRGTRNRSIEGLHKSLLPLNNIPIISHIFSKIPMEIEIVIAVGWHANQIISYVKKIHSDRSVKFIIVKDYDKPGSGPGASLLACKEELRCPFIFMPVDVVIEESYNFNNFDYNWVGYSMIGDSSRQDYCMIDGESTLNKFYYGTGEKIFAGMAGIYDYDIFFNSLENNKDTVKNEIQVTNGFIDLKNIKLVNFKSYDVGDDKSYSDAKLRFNSEIVAPKNNEVIFIDKGKVVKYFSDSDIVANRIDRVKYLNGTCPNVENINENMYCYDFIPGKTLSKINDNRILKSMLHSWHSRLCNLKFDKNDKFVNNCKTMYIDKTYSRCGYFAGSDVDNIRYVNGVMVEPIITMLDKIDWNIVLKCAIPSFFHGDLQPENIIVKDNNFRFIDWRDSFGDSTSIGDIYYDLGKLYHALLVNGEDIKARLYKIDITNNEALISNHSRSNLLFLLNELRELCRVKKYSWENVKLLGCLQYLSIASLYGDFHNGDYSKFLFLYGKYILATINLASDRREYGIENNYE